MFIMVRKPIKHMFKEMFLLAAGALVANSVASSMYYHYEKERLFKQARDYCDSIGKPLLNVGCGNNPMQIGDVNVDIFPPSEAILPNYQQADITSMPFTDKQFGCVVAFHVLEHVEDPRAALAEINRVADRVYASVPAPFDFSTDTSPDHKYTFYWGRMEANDPTIRWLVIAGVVGALFVLAYMEGR